ncbi:hypothetical protein D3C71_1245010 [compost metagenome]
MIVVFVTLLATAAVYVNVSLENVGLSVTSLKVSPLRVASALFGFITSDSTVSSCTSDEGSLAVSAIRTEIVSFSLTMRLSTLVPEIPLYGFSLILYSIFSETSLSFVVPPIVPGPNNPVGAVADLICAKLTFNFWSKDAGSEEVAARRTKIVSPA